MAVIKKKKNLKKQKPLIFPREAHFGQKVFFFPGSFFPISSSKSNALVPSSDSSRCQDSSPNSTGMQCEGLSVNFLSFMNKVESIISPAFQPVQNKGAETLGAFSRSQDESAGEKPQNKGCSSLKEAAPGTACSHPELQHLQCLFLANQHARQTGFRFLSAH